MNQSNRCALAASVLVLLVALLSSPAFAQAPVAGAAPDLATRVADLEAYITNGAPKAMTSSAGPGHNAWMMTSSALVLFMTLPGLALFYGGLVRRKNVLSVHGAVPRLRRPGHHPVVGWSATASRSRRARRSSAASKFALLKGVDAAPNTDYAAWVSQNVFSMYQLMFAIITPALIVGAIAERMKYSAIMAVHRALDVRRLLPARPHGVGRRRLDERRLERRAPRSRRSTSPAARSCTCRRAGRRWCSA